MTQSLVCHCCGYRGEDAAALGTRCPKDGFALVAEADHAKAPKDVILGRVIGGKYPVVGLIGSGGMGSVYRALQEPVGREVALKVIRSFGEEPCQANSDTLRARFFREAKVVAKLANPSAVTLYDYGVEDDGVLYMVLEYVRGRRLTDIIRAEGPLAPARAVPIACQVLNALAEAHGLGLIHRDLKPDNIMLVRGPWGEEQAKVLDFGIAKVRSNEKESTLETGTGLVLGTPLYMPPEQALARGAEHRSDLYSLGVVLYEMLTSAPPFTASTVFEVLLAHREKPVPPFPPELGVPPALEATVVKAMAKEPDARFADAEAMAQALLDALPAGAEDSRTAAATGRRAAMTPPAVAAMRTPVPGAMRQSAPGIPPTAAQPLSGLRTPVPQSLRQSGPSSAPVAGDGLRPAGTVEEPLPVPAASRSSEIKLSTHEQAALRRGPGKAVVFVLLGLGAIAAGAGAWYLSASRRSAAPSAASAIPDPDPKPLPPVSKPLEPAGAPEGPRVEVFPGAVEKPAVPPAAASSSSNASVRSEKAENSAPAAPNTKEEIKPPRLSNAPKPIRSAKPVRSIPPAQEVPRLPAEAKPVDEHGYKVPVF